MSAGNLIRSGKITWGTREWMKPYDSHMIASVTSNNTVTLRLFAMVNTASFVWCSAEGWWGIFRRPQLWRKKKKKAAFFSLQRVLVELIISSRLIFPTAHTYFIKAPFIVLPKAFWCLTEWCWWGKHDASTDAMNSSWGFGSIVHRHTNSKQTPCSMNGASIYLAEKRSPLASKLLSEIEAVHINNLVLCA